MPRRGLFIALLLKNDIETRTHRGARNKNNCCEHGDIDIKFLPRDRPPHPRSCSHSKKKGNDHISQRRIKNAIKVVGEDEKCAMSNTRIPEKRLAE
jgi:hypothetical protein